MRILLIIFFFFFKQKTAYEISWCGVQTCALPIWDAVYHKLRRRGSFDFPVLGVAAWVKWDLGSGERGAGRVSDARIVLGGVASYPQEVPEAGAALVGTTLSDDAIAAAAEAAFRPSKPMDNTDFDLSWRKQMTRVWVTRALEEVRGRRDS